MTAPVAAFHIESFFDAITSTVTYVLVDLASRKAAVIDPVLEYQMSSGRLGTKQADAVIAYIREQQLTLEWILETHAHADHVSAAQHIKQQLGGKVAIGARIREVQAIFSQLFNFERSFLPDGSQFDYLFADDEVFYVGELAVTALWVPGHTPADMAYQVGDAVFVGDTLFMPDVGTARADFPGGDAVQLFRSVQKLLALPEDTRLFMCHDYPPVGREPSWICTVAEQKKANIHVHDGISEDQFVALRTVRDKTLAVPTLIIPSVQLNVRAGHLPPVADNGQCYIQVPLNLLGKPL